MFGGFPGASDSKESACNAGDPGSILGLGRPLEKGMATHSSILAWRIPWTEETGPLQPMGSQSWTLSQERVFFQMLYLYWIGDHVVFLLHSNTVVYYIDF